jgi:hypothetical protein
MAKSTSAQHDKLQENTEPDLLLEATRKLEATCAEYVEWVKKPWEEATAAFTWDRVRVTPRAPASIQAGA